MFDVKCRTCGTKYPAGTDTSLICQTCGYQLGGGDNAPGGASILDRLLEAIGVVGNSSKAMADQALRLERRLASVPMDNAWPTAIQVPTPTATTIQDLGQPARGRTWQVRRITVGGQTATTVAAGAAYIFRQGAPPVDLNLGNLVAIFPAMPAVQFFSTHEFVVRPGEHVWAVVTGGTAGQQYVAGLQVEDWDEGAFTASEIAA